MDYSSPCRTVGSGDFCKSVSGVEANFMEKSELFYKLWEDAVIEQKDCNVVWNLCFRGQGDCPFWSSDTSGQFDTPQKRGKLISNIIKKQCDIVKKYVKNPVFCTNLYGEIMELYKDGYIEIDDGIIKVKADNGYGKMVTRRRDNHTARVSSMPVKDGGRQGIYYHVSFYDLQAANHITMLPNTVDFVNRELSDVLENGGDDFWVINCSNVRPHTYYLDAVRKSGSVKIYRTKVTVRNLRTIILIRLMTYQNALRNIRSQRLNSVKMKMNTQVNSFIPRMCVLLRISL